MSFVAIDYTFLGRQSNFIKPTCVLITRNLRTKVIASPPKLKREEQEEFEQLQRTANSEDTIRKYNENIDPLSESQNSSILSSEVGQFSPEFTKTIPEFEGNVNPVTGEVNGPKQDPLRHGDYSFNGRVTDF
ncbi:hypothetical protein KAFR_0C04220 [Kazachstania africana CBS 2517]|uniref:Succinate dehydrogenase assembly factor 4, mitochondrial n=1 Tax=Kazachstania africana (strain ATCC 22294 / BCRC 22015 / CBS 2517 / CECT 1963 / NBRC 1671 / NRRL Y-8276) TaxID=1071382 RepID=H2ASR3_KAZAF|nr:hypothetical protein KAFR_0C04220 [Kazachstania africana CBS 2517]CCF57413.1 hypothetical protein KAFR_0C04220 [Kazachstania africana CBS 2517]